MKPTKYTLFYQCITIAKITIDDKPETAINIKEMVDFWSGAEDRLRRTGGDYTHAWLKQLGAFIIKNNRLPNDNDEGWYALDGAYGITAKSDFIFEVDEIDIDISITGYPPTNFPQITTPEK